MCLETNSGLNMGTLTTRGEESIVEEKTKKGGAKSISHQEWLARSWKQYETSLRENDM